MIVRFIVLAIGLLAQVLGLEGDQTQWGTLGFATALTWGTVELLRGSILKAVDGIWVHVLAAATGIVFGLAFGYALIIQGTPFDWIVFGLQATFGATIADLAFKKAAGGKALPAPSEN